MSTVLSPSPGALVTAACRASDAHDPPGKHAPEEHPSRQAATVCHCVTPGETVEHDCAAFPLQRRSPGEQPALSVMQLPPAQPCGQVSTVVKPVPVALQTSTEPPSCEHWRASGAQTKGSHAPLAQPVAQKATNAVAVPSGVHCKIAFALEAVPHESAPGVHTTGKHPGAKFTMPQ
jgi:hypothetical protein